MATSTSTTPGSASVEVSPRLLTSPSAILRNIRRMILPERVLGSAGAKWMTSGVAIGPISRRTHCTSSLAHRVALGLARIERDIGVDALPLNVVRETDDCRLGDFRMRDQRAFDFGGAHPVARDVDHVIDAAGDPVIAILVAAAAVPGEILCRG